MRTNRERRVFALPGMAADRRMYPQPWDSIPGIQFVEWGPYSSELTIPFAAQRILEDHQIRDGDVVIGSSLGGMVGCEIAERVALSRLVLIGSAISNREINPFLRWIHPLSRFAPLKRLQRRAQRMPGNLGPMFAAADADFIRNMCKAIFAWEGLRGANPNLLRLHGTHDHVISRPSHVDLSVNGGHLISMTHTTKCLAFLKANGI